jgi:hypothetical protein
MTSPRHRTDGADADGVRVVRSAAHRADTWLVVAAGAFVVWLAWQMGEHPVTPAPRASAGAPAPDRADPPAASGEAVAAARSRHEVRRREIIARRIARKILPRTRGPEGKPEADAADAIAALRAAGVTEGIAAFEPPGTSPPRSGVIVPDDVELPEGYVRHYQTTDEGEMLPPILLFHPDYAFFDEAGNRVDVPEDRVVPPELVPPDIPIEILEPPGARPVDPR